MAFWIWDREERTFKQGSSCRAYTHLTHITASNSFWQSLDCWNQDCWNQRILCHGSPDAFRSPEFVGKRSWPVVTWVEDFKQLGFEVTAKTTPVHPSSLQIEVVVLDSAARYQSSREMLPAKCLRGQFWRRYPIKDSKLPRERIVPHDIRQFRWLQGWKCSYDRWSQSQDFTDFDQCILRPKDITWNPVNKKETCSL